MCLGVPMTVIETNGMSALCERRGEQRRVSVLLLDQPPVGAQVLVFIDNAVRLLDAEEARQIDNAIDGLAAASNGEAFNHLFADLIDREPQLPEHLRDT
jgi:hydrogenase expression/formation protein HypC